MKFLLNEFRLLNFIQTILQFTFEFFLVFKAIRVFVN